MTSLVMYDSTDVANLPPGAYAYAGYTAGNWPTWDALKAKFPHAQLVSIAISAADHAYCLDVENGDATPAQAPGWVKTEHARGVARPILYASASLLPHILAELAAAGIARGTVRLWSAHYGIGEHICGPAVKGCGYPQADATQWTDTAPGENGTHVDESLLAANFFPPPTTAPVKVLDGYLVTPGAAGGYACRAVTSADGGKSWT